MSDTRPPQPSQQAQNLPTTLAVLGQSLVAALPPAFLLLCVINLGFLWLVLRFIGDETGQRAVIVNRVLDTCQQIEARPARQ
jgi:hypothetical protein